MKAVQFLVHQFIPPDDIHVDMKHVQVHQASHWPGETIGSTGYYESWDWLVNDKEIQLVQLKKSESNQAKLLRSFLADP